MIRTIKQLICDCCGKTKNDSDDSFEDAQWWYRNHNWTTLSSPRMILHYCPECRQIALECVRVIPGPWAS
jgi:hypothetical protein